LGKRSTGGQRIGRRKKRNKKEIALEGRLNRNGPDGESPEEGNEGESQLGQDGG